MKKYSKDYKSISKVNPIVHHDHIYGFEVKVTEFNSKWSRNGKPVVTKKFFIDETKAAEYAESMRT
jgi:hypothetical protein